MTDRAVCRAFAPIFGVMCTDRVRDNDTVDVCGGKGATESEFCRITATEGKPPNKRD